MRVWQKDLEKVVLNLLWVDTELHGGCNLERDLPIAVVRASGGSSPLGFCPKSPKRVQAGKKSLSQQCCGRGEQNRERGASLTLSLDLVSVLTSIWRT